MMRAFRHFAPGALASSALASLLLFVGCDEADEASPSAPTGFTATPSGGTVVLSWRDDGEAIAIVRFPTFGFTPPDPPADLALVPGRLLPDGGVVIFQGRGDRFVDATADACELATYRAYALGRDGVRSAPAQLEVTPFAPPPGSPPNSLEASVVDGGVELHWEAPGTRTDLVDIQRGTGGLQGATSIHAARGAGAFVDRNELEPGATYAYAALACNACGTCSATGAEARVTIPVDFAPTDLTIDANGPTVDFTWQAPRAPFVTMRLLVRDGAPVSGPDDPKAERIHEGFEGEETVAHVATSTFLPDLEGAPHRYHFAVYACGTSGDCSEGAVAEQGFSLGDVMRGGGYIVYFRHAEAGICVDRTDLGTADETTTPEWWKSCTRSCDVATAEQLSAAGYEDAEAAGLALRNAGIPFDRLLTSEYCRAVETASRMQIVPVGTAHPREELTPFVHATDEERCTATRQLLAGAALGAPTQNAALVGHAGLPEPCADLEALAPGEAAVFRPGGDGPQLLTRILPRDWQGAL